MASVESHTPDGRDQSTYNTTVSAIINCLTGDRAASCQLDLTRMAPLSGSATVDSELPPDAIDRFVEWYCSEPRLSFSRTVVFRYRIHLESRRLAPGTINLR